MKPGRGRRRRVSPLKGVRTTVKDQVRMRRQPVVARNRAERSHLLRNGYTQKPGTSNTFIRTLRKY